MAFTQPTTELEAVNQILFTIGEAPVDTLDDSDQPLPADVAQAVRVLHTVSREVQGYGWAFNTEHELPLVRDTSGFINLPAGTLHADPDGFDADRDGVIRGARLYDRKNHTFVWDKDLTVTVKLLLPFTDLPQAARDYITIRAGRKFQAGAVGSQILNAYTETDELQALAMMKHEESESLDGSVIRDNVDNYLAFEYRGGGQRPY